MSSPLPQKRSRALSPFRGAAPCETHAPFPPARTVPEARFRRAGCPGGFRMPLRRGNGNIIDKFVYNMHPPSTCAQRPHSTHMRP